jgi:RHS repeat-associated protein
LDGLGRSIQITLQDGSQSIITATQFDGIGRKWRTWKPYPRVGAGYDPSFAGAATSYYNTYLGQSQAKPYVETQYTSDALARVTRVIPEYVGTTPSAFTLTNYGLDAALKQRLTEIIDESGKKRRIYADAFGNEVRTILGYGATEATTTLQIYDVLGQRTQANDPRSLVTTYAFDTRGLLRTKTSPDAGTVGNLYDAGGNLRFAQDANQAASGQVLFMNYDFASRPLVSGQAATSFGGLIPDASQGFEATTANWVTVRAYDAKPSTATFPWSLFSAQITPLAPTNVSGRLTATASKSNGAWQVTLFSYDVEGQVDTRWTFTQANGGGSVLVALNTSVTYVRDLRDALLERRVTVGSATFNHWYDYDNRGLLWKVYASTTGVKPGVPDVTYTYRPSGQMEGRQFQGGPLVPLQYGIREQLEKIGDPASTAYPFSASYAYHPNGTLAEAQFYSSGSPAAEKRYRYLFPLPSYDALNRLTAADYQGWNGTGWTVTAAHDLSGITYDVAGNIKTLLRYQNAGAVVDNLTYTYPAGSNRLSAIADAAGVTAETWDAEAGGFTYDANGNVLTAAAPYSVTTVSYDYQNRPVSLTRSGVTSTYRYDDAGQRIVKQVGAGNSDVYVLDGPLTMGVVTVDATGAVTAWQFNVVAVERVVGRQPSVGNRRYYHTDLLGSTRAVVEGLTVVESYDFEPWGLLMPGRTLGSGTREGFTGKEQDAESGLQYFGARYYMPALGRFAGVDPMAEKFPQWSPYAYTLDNPLALVDPDGKCPAFITGKPCSGAIALAVGFIPVVGDIVDVASAVVGTDLLTGEKLSAGERLLTVVGTIVGSGRGARVAVGAAAELAEGAVEARRATRVAAHADDAADAVRTGEKIGGDAAQTGRRIPNSELTPPTERGRAPIGNDGQPVELHHPGQQHGAPLDEMTQTEHRRGGNFKRNHPNTGQERSKVDRQRADRERRQHWCTEWDEGRWKQKKC